MDSIPRFLECSGSIRKRSATSTRRSSRSSASPTAAWSIRSRCMQMFRRACRILARPGGRDPPRDEQEKARRHRRRAHRLHPRRPERGTSPAASRTACRRTSRAASMTRSSTLPTTPSTKRMPFRYAFVTYRTAYMKCHYPREYMAALLTSVLDNSTKVAEYIAECRDMGIKLLPPDVNESDARLHRFGREHPFRSCRHQGHRLGLHRRAQGRTRERRAVPHARRVLPPDGAGAI